MNRKIYLNDKFMEFVSDELQTSHNQAIKYYHLEKAHDKSLKNILHEFLDPSKKENIGIVFRKNFDKIFEEIKKEFYYIRAAGGFIERNGEFLCIHRHGRWDLPKGKLEKNETVEDAAIRECEEECSVKGLSILYPLNSSFHIYPFKNAFALKQSYWFYMTTDSSEALKPQTEEDIDDVRWFTKAEIEKTVLNDTYYTIKDVIKEALKI